MKHNIQKKDIAEEISKNTGFPKSLSQKIVNDLLICFIEQISNSGLYIKNFGKFKMISKKERIGRNPKTKEEYKITSRKAVSFIPSNKFKEFLNRI